MEINADPPPPQDITESIVAQTQLLRRLTEATEQQINVDHHPDLQAESLPRKIETFIRLKPPTFNYTQDPMDADDWLRVIESKLDLTDCTDKECVALAVHQLEGTTRSWWDSYCNSHANPASITWEEFARAFRDHHVPRQLLIQKAQEFRTMTQGTMKVQEYERHFTKMMRYALEDVNTDEKKQFWFHRGLHHRIRHILAGSIHQSYQDLVNCAIAVETERLAWEDRNREKKRKANHQPRNRILQKPRSVPPLPPRNSFRFGPIQPSRNISEGGNQLTDDRDQEEQTQDGEDHNQPLMQETNAETPTVICFTCNQPGHKSYRCPEKKT